MSEKSEQPQVLAFSEHLGRHVDPIRPDENALTLRRFYEEVYLPDSGNLSPRTLGTYRTSLKSWEAFTGNPHITIISKDHLVMLRDAMIEAGRKETTVNKVWRHVKAILQVAEDEGYIAKVPRIARRMKSKLIPEPAKVQRDLITPEELTKLWHACAHATYPGHRGYPTADIWRTALLLFWVYGPRTNDLASLRWRDVLWNSRTIRFEAHKTRKIQGLPITRLVAAHLVGLKGIDPEYIFGRMRKTKGTYLRRGGRRRKSNAPHWQHGFRRTWRAEILPAAGIEGLQFRHFRESMVTRYNGIEFGLGNWIAGHYVPGVSAQSYDLPTERIRKAIEAAEVPECFRKSASPWVTP